MTTTLAPLHADRAQLAPFVDALFRYADEGTYVSFRAFRDDIKNARPVLIQAHAFTDVDALADAAEAYATQAAQFPNAAVFCPPVVTLTNAQHAREVDVANGLALSVECDTRPAEARTLLESLLGPATVVVASGGIWLDPADGTPHPKLHLHWRLSEPTSTPFDHQQLKRARIVATALVGGDATNTPAVHPIRWPGSWHRKGAPRLAAIVTLHADAEIALAETLETLESARATMNVRVGIGGTSANTTTPTAFPFGPPTSDLVRQILSGDAMHAPLCALAWRYLQGGMGAAQVVLTLRGVMESVADGIRNADPARWQGHYDDIPRTVRTAEAKVAELAPSAQVDISALTAPRLAILPPTPSDVPADLLTPPGVLGDVARYGLESAVRPVPVYAAQAALALGAVVCARRFVTSRRNYSPLYFMNVGKSGTGKEEAKTTIETILSAAGVRRLVGGSTYSSGNAVYSALLSKPQHIAIIDEFGKYMEGAAATRDNFRSDVLTMFMECFGRVHADMSTPQFSTMTMRTAHASEVEPRIIQRPAVTLLALTTPGSFYGALSSTRVLDGFLNRFLVVEHTGARTPARDADPDVPVPASAVDWIQTVLAPRGDLDDLFRLDHLPAPTLVPLTSDALLLSGEFETEMLKRAASLDRLGFGDMPIRTREIGLRLGLICAISENPTEPAVTGPLLEWAFRYVRFYLEQTLASLGDRMADSEQERTRNRIYGLIRETGARGVTDVEFNKRPFVGLGTGKRERYEILDSLIKAEEVAWTDVPLGPRGGRPRRAVVAIMSHDGDDGDGERVAA